MPLRKRQPPSPSPEHDDEHDEKSLDPKLAEHPDVPEDEFDKPHKKRKTEGDTTTKAAKKESESKNIGGTFSYNGANQNDWNPSPGTLPEKNTPLMYLKDKLEKQGASESAQKGGNVLWLMGMKSLRIEDNKGLAHASELAQERRKANKDGGNLIVAFFISPKDWKMHDRSARRIDFVLRNLREIKKQLDELNIPLVIKTTKVRKDMPKEVVELAKQSNVTDIIGNVEYEVDECWRDAAIVDEASKAGLHANFLEDAYVVPASVLKTKTGGNYAVFSPWNRQWTDYLLKNPHQLEEAPGPEANDKSARSGPLKDLFRDNIPKSVEGFECTDHEYMEKLFPAGSAAARRVLDNFMRRKGGEKGIEFSATGEDFKDTGSPGAKDSRVSRYGTGRNLMSENGTSRLSPYLAAGVISPRACLRATMALNGNKLKVGRDTGSEMWNTEISFRDFYAHVLALWPRVCMRKAYIRKYEDVKWEYDDKTFEAWTKGLTGYPIVDAAQRQAAKQGYMHNRGRMIVAMFLTKHLMLDWKQGEKWFNENLIDHDFASNNGGWQWSASTGTDPQPYFRIFNPTSQSEKSDPTGEYIRHWVPELREVKGKAIHAPFERLGKKEFEALKYPKPIVDHREARERALRRFKDPGCK